MDFMSHLLFCIILLLSDAFHDSRSSKLSGVGLRLRCEAPNWPWPLCAHKPPVKNLALSRCRKKCYLRLLLRQRQRQQRQEQVFGQLRSPWASCRIRPLWQSVGPVPWSTAFSSPGWCCLSKILDIVSFFSFMLLLRRGPGTGSHVVLRLLNWLAIPPVLTYTEGASKPSTRTSIFN